MDDRERWNKKYNEGFLGEKKPSDLLLHYYHLAKVGKALDLAAGLGRNSLFLAEKGFLVDAVDISDHAIEKLKTLHENINPIHADLKTFRPQPDSYDLIVNINFLERNLFPYIKESLKKDGVLIFETFLEGSPSKNKDFLLRKNELLHSFILLEIIFYQEKEVVTCKNEKAFKAYLVAIKRC